MNNFILKLCVLCLFFVSYVFKSYSQDGEIKGRVIDRETQKPLKDALVNIIDLNLSSITDSTGYFEFNKIPYGSYRLKFSILGYEAVVKTDNTVLASRPTEVLAELNPVSYMIPEINVEAKYFEKPSDISSSIYNLDFEEIRRAPGAVEDISRMVQVLPGVAPGNDQRNDLIVRGGSPSENLIL